MSIYTFTAIAIVVIKLFVVATKSVWYRIELEERFLINLQDSMEASESKECTQTFYRLCDH